MATDTDNTAHYYLPRPSAHVITKGFYTYTIIILRQDKRLRDHGGRRGGNGEIPRMRGPRAGGRSMRAGGAQLGRHAGPAAGLSPTGPGRGPGPGGPGNPELSHGR